jgi:hypothetical protein
MARIRTIKPEFWTSDQVTECSIQARLLFIGMWNFCDDTGRHAASPKQLKAEVFPSDLTVQSVSKLVDELLKVGLLVLCETEDGRFFYQVTGWHHQVINRPQKSRFPAGKPVIHGMFSECSVSVHAGKEGNGKEGNGMEGSSSFTECSVNEPAVLTFPCHGSPEHWDLMQSQIDEWAKLYPTVDVLAESRKALAWAKANGLKTSKGMPKFLVGWFGRTNDRSGGRQSPNGTRQRQAPTADEIEAMANRAMARAKEALDE